MATGRKRYIKKRIKDYLHRFLGITLAKRNPHLESGLIQTPDLDTLLAWYLHTTGQKPFFIQIGANDGVSYDPINALIRRYHLPGLLVEPQVNVFEELQRNYSGHGNLQFANAAVTDTDGELTFYGFSRALDDPATGFKFSALGALDRQDAIESFQHIAPQYGIQGAAEDHLVTQQVPGLRFETLLKNYAITDFDMLVIDAEGHDLNILQQVDLTHYAPSLVYYEHGNLDEDARVKSWRYLRSHGYTPCLCGINTLGLNVIDTNAPDRSP